jgi:hypothetical protein
MSPICSVLDNLSFISHSALQYWQRRLARVGLVHPCVTTAMPVQGHVVSFRLRPSPGAHKPNSKTDVVTKIPVYGLLRIEMRVQIPGR